MVKHLTALITMGAALCACSTPPPPLVAPRPWAQGTRIAFGGVRAGSEFLVQSFVDTTHHVDVTLGRTADGELRLVPSATVDSWADPACTEPVVFVGARDVGFVTRTTPRQVCELPAGIPQATVFALGAPRAGPIFSRSADGGCELSLADAGLRPVMGAVADSEWLGVTLTPLALASELTTWWATAADGTAFAARLTWRGHTVWRGSERPDGLTRLYTDDALWDGVSFQDSTCTEQALTAAPCGPGVGTRILTGDCAEPVGVTLGAPLTEVWTRENSRCTRSAAPRSVFSGVTGSETPMPRLPAVARSNERLVVHWLEVPDAGSTSLQAESLFDRTLGAPCVAEETPGGAPLCVPLTALLTHFADATCSVPLASVFPSSCSAPTLARSLGSSQREVRELRERYVGARFVLDGGRCVSAPANEPYDFFQVGPPRALRDVFAVVQRVSP